MKRFWRLVISVISYGSSQVLVIWGDTGMARVLRACLFYWRNRCSTGSSCSKADQRLTRVSFSFTKKHFFGQFSVIFKSVQSSTCLQNEPGSRVRFSPGAWKFPLSRTSMVSSPSKLKMFTGSVCVLLTSVSLKLIKLKIKLIYATTSSWGKKKMAGER